MNANSPIVIRFGKVVDAVSAELLDYLQTVDTNITGVQYQFGHPKEIVETLVSMELSQATQRLKYPLICVFQDYQEAVPNAVSGFKIASIQVVIVTRTLVDRKSKDRYSTTFEPILYPIYRSLVNNLAKSPFFASMKEPQHTKIDRPYWGREALYGNDAKIATDVLDAIELRNLQLPFTGNNLCATETNQYNHFQTIF